jgi:hypothetical protein
MLKLHNKMTPIGLFRRHKKNAYPGFTILCKNIQIGFNDIIYVLDITDIRKQSTTLQASLLSNLSRHFRHHSVQENHGGPDIMYTVHYGRHNH